MNIYVGNLNWNMTSEDLQDLFTPYGEVTSAKIVTDKFNNNRSKGFGFVEMSDDDAARTAISALHDSDIQGRKIVVNESTPRPEGERREGGGGGLRNVASAAVAVETVAAADTVVVAIAAVAAVVTTVTVAVTAAADTTGINRPTYTNTSFQVPVQ